MTILTKEDLKHLNISIPKFSEEEIEKIIITEFNYNDFLDYKANNEWYFKIKYSVCSDRNAWYRYNKLYQTILDNNPLFIIEDFFKDWSKDSNKDNLLLLGVFEYREDGTHIVQENYKYFAQYDFENGLSSNPHVLYARAPFQEVTRLTGKEAHKYLDHIYDAAKKEKI